MPVDPWAAYLQAEWDQFLADANYAERSLATVRGRPVSAVLDVGCGAGQELIPFVETRGATGVAVDVSTETLAVARRLLASVGLGPRVHLACTRAEALSLRAASFDVVICRGVLAYVDNRPALAEVSRVLRPAGLLMLHVNNLRFELRGLARGLRERDRDMVGYCIRHLAAGAIHHVLGRQPVNRLTGSEVFHSRWLLARELARAGLVIVGDVDQHNAEFPLYLVTHGAA